MKLYRGLKSPFRYFTPELEEELEKLEQKAKAFESKGNMTFLRELGKDESLVRLIELRQLKGRQAFTNNEGAARFVAGSNGYVVEVEIPDEAGETYYLNQAIMQIDGKNVPVDHFGIPGNELFLHKKEWHVNIHDIIDERRREGGPFRTIRQETDLSQHDRKALGDLRNLHPSGGEKK